MQRYFSNKLENNKFELNNDDQYHISRVMRMKTGDSIEVVYNSEVYICNLEINDNYINVLVNEKIEGLSRLRISSIEITELDDEFLEVLKNSKILVDHMHIPLQSGSNEILKLMNRKYDKEYFIDKINKIRTIRPDMSVTTDIIVGFPGETDELFKETIDTVNKIRFSKIHVFPFSLRKGTKAEDLPNHIDDKIKKDRVKELIMLSKELEIEYFNKFVGKKVEYLPEIYKEGCVIGHNGNYLSVKSKGIIEDINNIKEVTIKKVEYPYVIGE